MIHLKSNMDRFIVAYGIVADYLDDYLKSNMDRFIVIRRGITGKFYYHLKSNMDRFIEFHGNCIDCKKHI